MSCTYLAEEIKTGLGRIRLSVNLEFGGGIGEISNKAKEIKSVWVGKTVVKHGV